MKRVGASGQISLSKEFAGCTVVVDSSAPGFWVIKTGPSRSRGMAAVQLIVLLLVALAMLVPLLWLVSTSLKGPAEGIFTSPPALWPSQPSLEAYT